MRFRDSIKTAAVSALAVSIIFGGCGRKADSGNVSVLPENESVTDVSSVFPESVSESIPDIVSETVSEDAEETASAVVVPEEQEETSDPEPAAEPVYSAEDLIVLQDEGMYTCDECAFDVHVLASAYADLMMLDSLGTTADGRELYHMVIGSPDADLQVFINAGTHAREYITSQLVMKQAALYLQHIREDAVYGDYPYREMWNRCAVHVVPMVNPDGISISQFGLAGIQNEDILNGIYNIAAMDGAELTAAYLDRWKANAAGTDINRNFDAYWEWYSSGPSHPSSDHYKGEYPGSSPEAAALITLTNNSHFSRTISYHSQGRLIYWNFENVDAIYDTAVTFASEISAATGYPLESNYSTVDPAGYSDWGIYRCQIPSLTVEVGSGTCPYIQDQFGQIWAENINVWEITVLSALRY